VAVARYGPPDDPNFPRDEPTAYINYGDGPPPEEALPWYRKPVTLVAFGAVLIALIIFGLVKLLTGGTSDTPPATLTPITRTTTSVTAPTTTTAATTTEPTTTTTTTTTEPSVSTSISTSTSTVTETVTVPPPGG
jgi:hypothetical protein